MSVLTTEAEVLAISPDAASSKAAKGLVKPAKWANSGCNENTVWGQCQGSGKNPYLTRIDISSNPPAFKCSCPSRKFPCKHALALLLLRVNGQVPHDQQPPQWVQQWLDERQSKVQKKEEKQQKQKELAQDPKAQEKLAKQQAKQQAKRWQRIEDGMQELQRWMLDMVEQGLAQLSSHSDNHRHWRTMSARMVDAQMPGMAWRIQQGWDTIDSGEGWQQRLLAQMGHWQLMIDAVLRRDALHEDTRADLMAALGWTLDKNEVQTLAETSGATVSDQWQVLGIRQFAADNNLTQRHVWLQGTTVDSPVLLIDYTHGKRGFDSAWLVGACYQMTLAFYPGRKRLRAVPISPIQLLTQQAMLNAQHFASSPQAALNALTAHIAANPLQSIVPFSSQHATLHYTAQTGWWMVVWGDTTVSIPISIEENSDAKMPDEVAWQLLALTGSYPMALFGEWNGQHWQLLSAWQKEQENSEQLNCIWHST